MKSMCFLGLAVMLSIGIFGPQVLEAKETTDVVGGCSTCEADTTSYCDNAPEERCLFHVSTCDDDPSDNEEDQSWCEGYDPTWWNCVVDGCEKDETKYCS
jgi:hypothetical protein